jgi:small subunit ribosomal protein S4
MGFADSRKQARQLVRHGHFHVNGRKTNIPSFLVRPGDEIKVRPESRRREYFKDYGEVLQTKRAPDWMSVTIGDLSGKIMQLPTRDQIEVPIFNEALIVEHYSR